MRIALFTIFRVPNFGSVLQAFATQYCLESLGHNCVIIDYKKKLSFKKKIKSFFTLYRIACLLGVKPQFRKPGILNRFIKKNFHQLKKYEGIDSLRQIDWTKFDAIVVGSDQVWNSRYHGKDNVYLLPFINKTIPCYSLASSFAMNEIPNEYKDLYKESLSKFKAISVRENNGIEIVDSLKIGITAKKILDPTLWLDKEKWLMLSNSNSITIPKPYILLYMWTYAFEPRPYIYDVVKHWKAKLGVEQVIALEGSPKAWECDIKIIDKADSSIPQFMELFANAALVITSSFHGTAFAVNFVRPLISIVPGGNGDDRQSSLLKSVGAENSIVHIGDPLSDINPYYDTVEVSNRLGCIREDSIRWIKENIR